MVQQLWRKGAAAAFALVALSLALTGGVTSARWIDTPFPGFFVMANRVVASVSLPHWPVAHTQNIYQHVVVAVEGQPVATPEEFYAFVRRFPPGSSVRYTLEKDGQTSQVTLVSLKFTLKDYVLLFVVYLLNGLALALIGIGVWFLKPAIPASQALFIVGSAAGLFALTAADLYSPYWFFRLHVLGEALFLAGLVHLALVFPVNRLRRARAFCLFMPYGAALALGAAYEFFLYQPAAYSLIHNLCTSYLGIAGVLFLGKLVWDYVTTSSHLVRQRIRVILLGFLSGFTFPAFLMLSSGVTGGEIAVNYAGFTAFLFPLSLGYAIVKHDLFEIEVLLKRGVYYLVLTATLALLYAVSLILLNFTLHSVEFTRSPFFPLLFTLAVVFFLNPLRDSLQRSVDRVFFRLWYDPKKVLEMTSASLASTLRLEETCSLIWRTINETVSVQQGGLFLLMRGKGRYMRVYPRTAEEHSLAVEDPLIQELQQKGHAFSLYALANEAAPSEVQDGKRRALEQIGAQLVIPLIAKGDLVGLMVLGHKESGAFFSVDDIDFLHTLANQGALSITNALSYQEIEDLNAGLEQKVAERTEALAHANTELQVSLQRLEEAYRDLQHSQENLIRAEKMAALGRLAAGIAHEMNTPLGASLTSLKLVQELVEEYRASISDPEVNERDHQDIAAEMEKLVRAIQQWMEKAAAHIRSLKLHTRNLQRNEVQPFSVLQTIEDTALLLAHRLRFCQCTLSVSCSASEPILHGDPGKLGQVLTNLIVNAIDAYKSMDKKRREIRVEVAEDSDCLEIRVSDQGCGIPPENLGRIFDEFFSTKALGEGTGLGLSIIRDIVTNFFGGTVSVESVLGQGSVFLLRLPHGNHKQQPIEGAHQDLEFILR